MSNLTLNFKVMSKIITTAIHFNGITIKEDVNTPICVRNIFSGHEILTDDDIFDFFQTFLNCDCWNDKHVKAGMDGNESDIVNVFQFYKWLQCIKYNLIRCNSWDVEVMIDQLTKEKILDTLITELAAHIVSCQQEYIEASWS